MSDAPDGRVPALAVHGVSKSFGSNARVWRDVSFDLRAGEIHSLVGENGAGKSTLIKVMTGLVTPDSGRYGGRQTRRPARPADAQARHQLHLQEPQIFPDLTVSENIFMGDRGRGRSSVGGETPPARPEILGELEVDVDPAPWPRGLTVGAQQAVEIAKAMSRDVQVLIMDEPTAALSALRGAATVPTGPTPCGVRRRGPVLSHRLDEVFELGDRITVFRDGAHISTRPVAEVTEER